MTVRTMTKTTRTERLPMRPEAGDFLAVIVATLVLCLAAALYPAWRASRLDPVEAIRRQS